MNLTSFLVQHKNLRRLEILRPRFVVSIDEYLPHLDSLTLDIEYLHERTFPSAQHVHHLKFGSSLRRIDSRVFSFFPKDLQHLDFSDVPLSELTSDSRCSLIHFLQLSFPRRQLNIVFPRIDNMTECDCARLFLRDIQTKKSFSEHSLCSKQCRFSDCATVSAHFRERYPLFADGVAPPMFSNETREVLPSIDLIEDSIDDDLISYLLNQSHESHTTTKTAITWGELGEDTAVVTMSIDRASHSIDSTPTADRSRSKTELFPSSMWPFVGVLSLFFFVCLLIGVVVFIVVRTRQRKYFKRVPVYV